jgi:N-acetylglucosaminyldiphosphoundecaprenol N-acetyl-beta-D-mannosaminyltransferase
VTTVVARHDQAAELGTDQPRGRSELGGVPIDRVDLDAAVDRAMEAVATSSFTQICTVNLDFLVNARRDPATGAVLSHSELNLADGAPVVWLSRLLGSRLPGQVAGSDLVPRLAASAADSGAGIFFLGGEDGNATVAAERLAERFPGLVVAGIHEPARAALEEMDDDDIVRRLEESGADILLVALGHPKQDKWIARNRDRLPVSVAVGVGCTFDLIAGRRTRAPRWMRRTGLEWLFRLVHEPSRLGLRYFVDGWCLLTVFIPMTVRQRRLTSRPA